MHKNQHTQRKLLNFENFITLKLRTLKTLIFASYWGSPLAQFWKFNNYFWLCWFFTKIFLILYPWSWNSITGNAIRACTYLISKCWWFLIVLLLYHHFSLCPLYTIKIINQNWSKPQIFHSSWFKNFDNFFDQHSQLSRTKFF